MDSKQAYEKAVEANINRLMDNYATLLTNAQVKEEILGHESLQIQAAAANIVYSCQSLLDQVQEVRLHVLLQDTTEILKENEEEKEKLQHRLQEAHEGPK